MYSQRKFIAVKQNTKNKFRILINLFRFEMSEMQKKIYLFLGVYQTFR